MEILFKVLREFVVKIIFGCFIQVQNLSDYNRDKSRGFWVSTYPLDAKLLHFAIFYEKIDHTKKIGGLKISGYAPGLLNFKTGIPELEIFENFQDQSAKFWLVLYIFEFISFKKLTAFNNSCAIEPLQLTFSN